MTAFVVIKSFSRPKMHLLQPANVDAHGNNIEFTAAQYVTDAASLYLAIG
jgi:hypothetical protein